MASDKRKLSDLEGLFKAAGYAIRYERGHFRAGHCLVHERRVVVVNRFLDAAARLQKLRDLAGELDFAAADLSEEHAALLASINARSAAEA